jgi:membrane protein DedA with SNARE-associated domain
VHRLPQVCVLRRPLSRVFGGFAREKWAAAASSRVAAARAFSFLVHAAWSSSADVLVHTLTQFGYLALVASLVLGGLGMPVPEELVQLTAGYLARRGILDFAPALACTWGGIVLGDFLFFRLARSHGEKLLARRHVARLLTPARRAALDRHFDRHAFLTVLVARHTSGFRLAAYALAATHGVPSRTFVLADGISALLSVPLVVTLGWWFAGRIDEVRRRIHHVELALLAAILVGVGIWLAVRWWRDRDRPAAPPRARLSSGRGPGEAGEGQGPS